MVHTYTLKLLFIKILSPLPLLLVLLILNFSSQAQTGKGTITGTIADSTGHALEHVSVGLKGTSAGNHTDKKGTYTISNVTEGSYTLIIQMFGFKTVERTVEVKANETTEVPVINLKEELHELNEVNIEVNRNKFAKKESEYVAKLPLKDIENPQVYNTITAELLKDQVVTNFNDALKNAPGIDKLWESTGRGGDGAGYFSLRGFAVQPTMINGLPGLTNGGMDPANIERIEVIKGPSGTLYGSSLISYGGLINIVTKRPYDTFGGEINYNAGSFGLNRITADINTPLTKERNVALRINSAYHTENSFQDAGFRKSFFVAPSLSYKVNEKLSFLFNTEFLSSEGTNPTMLFLNRTSPLAAKNLDELNYSQRRSYTSNDVTIRNPSFSLQGQMIYKLSDKWTSQTVLSRSAAKTDGYYSYLWDLADGKGTYTRYISKQNSTTLTTDIQQNFTGDFKIGSLRNRVVAGLDYFHKNIVDNNSAYVAFDKITIQDADPTRLSRTALDTALAKVNFGKSGTELETYSAYISDVLNITPKFSLMASLRLDHFSNKGSYNVQTNTTTGKYSQTALSPKLGIVYQLVSERLSLFANYMNGYKNAEPRIQNNNTRESFRPEQANQWEAGIKADIAEGRLAATLSYYDIMVSDVVRMDPNNMNSYIQDGSNYSKGFETSIIATPLPGLNFIAGYSYNESKVTKTDNAQYRDRRPENAGPKHLVNTWISYRFGKGLLKGLGAGVGGNHASEYATLDRASTGTFFLPAYTVFNASVSYDATIYRIALKLDNLTDKEYYKGWSTINPQKPRSLTASFTYKF